jgi:hypothetical protein
MSTDTTELTIALAQRAVAAAAPEELPLFPALSEHYRRPAARRAGTRDERLGFGSADAVALLTPAILAIAAEVSQYLLEEVKQTLKDHGAALVTKQIESWFKHFEGAPPPMHFSQAQRERVRVIAFTKARQLDLDQDRAHLLADALVGALPAEATEK